MIVISLKYQEIIFPIFVNEVAAFPVPISLHIAFHLC